MQIHLKPLDMFNSEKNLRKQSDEILIPLIAKGNSNAFTAFVAHHQGWIRDVIHRIQRNKAIEDDTYQRFLIKIWKAFCKGTYREDGKLRSWLNRVLSNELKEMGAKKSQYEHHSGVDEYFETLSCADKNIQQFEVWLALETALASIAPGRK